MMKDKTFLLMVFLLAIVGNTRCFAQTKVQGVIVELSSGEKMEYRLADHPKMVFDGQTVELTADGVSLNYTPSEIAKVTMGEVDDVSSGIKEQESSSGEISVNSGFVRFSGFQPNESVRVYSMDGIIRATYHTLSDGSLVVPLSNLPSGISIIKVNKESIKITRR